MKTLISESGRDFIIEETTSPVFDDNKIIYIDEPNKIALHKGRVSKIFFYEDEIVESAYTGRATKICLDAQSIKKLHDIIMQIEDKRTEEFYHTGLY